MTQTINLKVYGQLIAEVKPKVVETEDEYKQFLAVAEQLTFQQNQTPEESALYDLVTMLVEAYEVQHHQIDLRHLKYCNISLNLVGSIGQN